jgi:hydrogenase maturation protein HypF
VRERLELTVSGVVQGIGFRPFVYRIATRHGLAGHVQNTGVGVTICVEGERERIEAFRRDFDAEMPPLARIDSREEQWTEPAGDEQFVIVPSQDSPHRRALAPPDLATCDACLRELFDPADRRYRHPFINCTDCGPRYTILDDLPYDRAKTSMARFPMCPACEREYHDPADRRFHAQPVCCHDCGPTLSLLDSDGQRIETDEPIEAVRQALQAGQIAAIRGIGGFHLAVDATNAPMVAELRRCKRRSNKPFAIMCRSLDVARSLCEVGAEEAELLTSPARPIVLLRARQPSPIAPSVAPDNPLLGVMLPYTGLHVLLMGEDVGSLVMTSANFSDEPILAHADPAVEQLGSVVDLFLTHDRDIRHRADDSVARVMAGGPLIIRRSRGYVLGAVPLPADYPPILAVGAEMKNTVCLNRGRDAFPSQHLGDTDSREGLAFFEETVEHLQRLLGVRPEVIAHDLHPDYLTTRYAEGRPEPNRVAVQHHEAHVAAVQAEHRITDRPVVGISLDGTGYGRDGTVWGGEVFVGCVPHYRRAAHLRPVALPGGEAAVRQPWRMAVSYLVEAFGDEALGLPLDVLRSRPDEAAAVADVVRRRLRSPVTSSTGRLFDAVSALLGVCEEMTFEGEPAIALEMCLPDGSDSPPYAFELVEQAGVLVADTRPLIRGVVADILGGESASAVSACFHATVVALFVEAASRLAREHGVEDVTVGGGVLNNARIMGGLLSGLEQRGLRPRRPLAMPPGDGGISLGQLVMAGETIRKGDA